MASSYAIRSVSSAETFNKFTISCWFRGIADGTQRNFWGIYDNSDSNRFFGLYYSTNGSLYAYWKESSIVFTLGTMQKFKDPTSWYHFVMSVDTTLATASDRVKFYLNGERITIFEDGLETITQSKNITLLNGNNGRMQWGGGKISGTQYYWNGNMSHCHMCIGYAYDASSFGSTDATTGTWKINTSPSVQYGTNGGFWFKDGNQLTDSSINSNTLTASGTLTKTEDNPSNVFCVMNPVPSNRTGFTWYNGYTRVNTPGSSGSAGTMGMTKGKWYYECLINTLGNFYGGWQDLDNQNSNTNNFMVDGCVATNNGPDIYYGQGSSGYKSMNGMAAGDYIGFAIDIPNLKCWWSRNGQWYTANSSTASTLTRAQVSANTSGFDLTTGSEMNSSSTIAPYMGSSTNATNNSFNFGNGAFGSTQLTGTTYNDDSGNGIFKYEPPAGFKAICTKNINEFG